MTDAIAGALQEAAAVWYRDCFQIKRTNGFYERGEYRRINSELTWAKGNVQPAEKLDIERLPEGSRADGALTVFTDAELRTTETPNQLADRILYKGTEYEVSDVERWPSSNRYVWAKVGQ